MLACLYQFDKETMKLNETKELLIITSFLKELYAEFPNFSMGHIL